MGADLHIPEDATAEEGVSGCCVDSERGYQMAASRVAADDFYRPDLRRLFEACGRLDLPGTDLDTREARIARAAELAGVAVDQVRRIVDDRPLQWDTNGTLAGRVRRAADARRAMTAARDLFNRLGEGEPLEQVVADLAPDLRRLVGVAS